MQSCLGHYHLTRAAPGPAAQEGRTAWKPGWWWEESWAGFIGRREKKQGNLVKPQRGTAGSSKKNPFLQSATPTFTTLRGDLGTFGGKAT